MGANPSKLDLDEPLTLERARELMGDTWEARYEPVFEGELPTLGEAAVMLRELAVEQAAGSSTALRFVRGRGACAEVVAKGRAATRARTRARASALVSASTPARFHNARGGKPPAGGLRTARCRRCH